jgi:uncharacterized cofD-like protein
LAPTQVSPPRVVAIGGGTGLPAVLRGLRGRARVTAVVAVSDDGGSSGRLRREGRATLAPGDLRNCLVALAEEDAPLARAFQFRFDDASGLAGHALGNLLLAALAETEGSFTGAIDLAAGLLRAAGRVLPATADAVGLEADLADGRVVRGESALAAERAAKRTVRLIRLSPGGATAPAAAPGVVEAIAGADLVVLGPGSLYTSVIPALLPYGASAALRAARGPRVLVANLTTQRGETDGYALEDHLRALNAHAGGRVVDLVLAPAGPPPEDFAEAAARRGAAPLRVDPAAIARESAALVTARLVRAGAPLRHDPRLLGDALLAILARPRGARSPIGYNSTTTWRRKK